MPAEFFGQYLLEKGLISREEFLKAARDQADIGVPLCALAISQGCLDANQLRQLDKTVAETGPGALERMARDGVLSVRQLEDLQRLPAQRGLYLGEALIRGGILSPTRFAKAFADYRRECPGAVGPTTSIPAGARVPHRIIVEAFTDSLVNVFVHYTRRVVRVARVTERLDGFAADDCVVRQRVTGAVAMQLGLVLPAPLAREIAAGMFGEPVNELGPAAIDALCEFLNVVSGGACAALGERGLSVRVASPPAPVAVASFALKANDEVVVVTLETTTATLRCAVLFEGEGHP